MRKVIFRFIKYLICSVASMLAFAFVLCLADGTVKVVKAQEQVDNKRDITLTDSEKYPVRTAEFNKLTVLLALGQANQDMDAAINHVYEIHKVTRKTHSLCAGPGVGVCEGVPKDEIVLRKNPDPVKK